MHLHHQYFNKLFLNLFELDSHYIFLLKFYEILLILYDQQTNEFMINKLIMTFN